MKCEHCGQTVYDGIIVRERPYCDRTCAEARRRDLADLGAKAQGFGDFEEMAEARGATTVEFAVRGFRSEPVWGAAE